MLGRTHRFHGYNSLRRTYQNGKTARSAMLGLRYAARDSKQPYRVAVVVSRKVSKSAVIRNRIRRRVYAAVRQKSDLIPPGTDLIFTVFTDQVAALEVKKLEDTVASLLQKTT